MNPQLLIAGAVLLLLLLRKKPAAAPPPQAPADDDVLQMPPDIITVKRAHPHLELSNGFEIRVEVSDQPNATGGNVTNGTYFDCVDGDGNTVDDSKCMLVQREWPDVKIPIDKLIRMTQGRQL